MPLTGHRELDGGAISQGPAAFGEGWQAHRHPALSLRVPGTNWRFDGMKPRRHGASGRNSEVRPDRAGRAAPRMTASPCTCSGHGSGLHGRPYPPMCTANSKICLTAVSLPLGASSGTSTRPVGHSAESPGGARQCVMVSSSPWHLACLFRFQFGGRNSTHRTESTLCRSGTDARLRWMATSLAFRLPCAQSRRGRRHVCQA